MPALIRTNLSRAHVARRSAGADRPELSGPGSHRRRDATRAHSITARLCLVFALAVTGCTGVPDAHQAAATHSPHSAFIAAANAVCEQAVKLHEGHPFPLDQFDPLHPQPSQLPTVGNYFARYGQLPETVRALHALKPPAEDADAWRFVLGVADRLNANVHTQIAAARARDVAAFVPTVLATKRLTERIDTAGRRFGFSAHSPCGQVFG
jgi:hypothetical protein